MMNHEHSHMAMNSIGHMAEMIQAAWQSAAAQCEEHAMELRRPFYMMKPRVFQDGNQWCALLGENIQEGVCGFGASPHLATKAFDAAWHAPTQEPT